MTFNKQFFSILIWTLIILLSFYPISFIRAHINIDSLENVVAKQKGKEKLNTLSIILHSKIQTPETIKEASRLEAEAKRQKNSFYLGSAYRTKADYYDDINEIDSLYHYSNLARIEFEKTNDTIQLISAELFDVYSSVRRGKPELAIHMLNNMFKDKRYTDYMLKNHKIAAQVYSNLGAAHLYSGQYEKAIESFQTGLEEIWKSDEYNPTMVIHYYVGLEIAAYKSNQLDLAKQYTDSLSSAISQMGDTYSQESVDNYKLICAYSYSNIYLDKGQLELCRQQLDSAQSYLGNQIQEQFRRIYFMSEARYYSAIGKYNKALQYVDLSLEYFTPEVDFHNNLELQDLKAKILAKGNNYDQAYHIITDAYHLRDSIYQKQISEQMHEMETLYRVENMKNDIKENLLELEKTHLIIVTLSIVTLLLFVIIFLVRHNSNEQKQKNKKLFDQNRELATYVQKLRTLNHNVIKEEDFVEKGDSLGSRVEAYLRINESFKASDISRNDIALELGTNRQYLTEAIKEFTGKTFTDYINDMRLEYAYSRLLKDMNETIENILKESGFSTRATFNRLFKQKYGMTPNELRQTAMNADYDD